MRFLLSSPAYNMNTQNVALALYEAGALGAYYSTGVDHFHHPATRSLRWLIERTFPWLDRELRRRRISLVPGDVIHSDWTWESLRTLVSRLRVGDDISDWFWAKSEHRLDRRCAHAIQQKRFDAFIGAPHSSLRTLQQARSVRKPSALIYLSPHHIAYERWVESEYAQFPELRTATQRKVVARTAARNERCDKEIQLADLVITESRFTAESIIEAGVPPHRIIIAPMVAPPPIPELALPSSPPNTPRLIYAGNVSVTKGVHYLLRAWSLIESKVRGAELHLFGAISLPSSVLPKEMPSIRFHGSVRQSILFSAFDKGTALVFPTLFDGFGIVITEAFAHGLPVITTPNAGAADLIEEGKNGFIVPPKAVEALAERMLWCIEHPQELMNMRKNCLETAQKHRESKRHAEFRTKLGAALGIRLYAAGEEQQ